MDAGQLQSVAWPEQIGKYFARYKKEVPPAEAGSAFE